MLLEFGKAVSFVLSILSLYRVAISAFFVQATPWQARLWMALPAAGIAACVCCASGLVFRWPARSNPEAGLPLRSSLPVMLMLWVLPGMTVLFAVGWYLVCGRPDCVSYYCQ